MELKYVGPKPIISHTGVKFDNNKEDKYVYLHAVIQLLKALHHDYSEDKVYKYDADTHQLRSDELHRAIKEFCPDINLSMEHQKHKIENILNHYTQRLQRSITLTNIEKEAFANNLKQCTITSYKDL